MAEKRPSYGFGEFRLDPQAASLRRGQQELDLPPKALHVLTYLIENRQRVVPKQELVETLWKDTFVTDDALVQVIAAVRHALGDDPEEPHYIRTKPRVGYQFIAGVEVHAAVAAEPAATPTSVWEAPIGRGRARGLLLLIQVGYLGLYSVTLLYLDKASRILAATLLRPVGLGSLGVTVLVVLAMIGVAVRLYLMAAVALDHPQTGRQFKRLFPALLVLDIAWAFAPLLLVGAARLPLALVLVPVIAYAPFAQRTLIRSAYAASAASA